MRGDNVRVQHPEDLTRFAWLSIAAAVATIALKTLAWRLTGSVGLASDAAESVVNLVAAVVALIALRAAAKPPDATHMYGHTKAEYFSSAIEGGLIFVAAVAILYTSVLRFLNPQPVENGAIGLGVAVVASLINGAVAAVLLRAAAKHTSITLRADGHHLLTDVWTSVGVLVGVGLVVLTGWHRLDPVVAFLVGLNIIWTGWKLLRDSANGLMDGAWVDDDVTELVAVITPFTGDDVKVHELRTRQAGRVRFAQMHVQVPGDWTVTRGHDLASEVEQAVRDRFPEVRVTTHLEPLDDPGADEGQRVGLEIPAPPGA